MNELQILELEELQRQSADELEGFNIDSLDKLNWTFRKMSAIQAKVNDIKQLAEAERIRINTWEKKELSGHEQSLEFFKMKISAYHESMLNIDPKLKSIKTPYGTAKSVTSKAAPMKHDEKLLIDYLNMYNPDFVKETKKEEVIWSDFKKLLTIVDGPDGEYVVDDRGMIVEGVGIKPQSTTFSVEV